MRDYLFLNNPFAFSKKTSSTINNTNVVDNIIFKVTYFNLCKKFFNKSPVNLFS